MVYDEFLKPFISEDVPEEDEEETETPGSGEVEGDDNKSGDDEEI